MAMRKADPANGGSNQRTGLAVDRTGGPVVDPTANVLDLVEAAVKRIDDLRDANTKFTDARLDHLHEVADLRAKHAEAINNAESRRLNEQLALRADYSGQLSVAEAKRIDAIRAVDVNAVSVASQRAADQATVLASQVSQSAEALRNLVASTANTVAQSQQQLATTLSTRITTLEQAQYEGKGKSALADPQMVELLMEVKSLRSSKDNVVGVVAGANWLWGAVLGLGGLILGAIPFIISLLK